MSSRPDFSKVRLKPGELTMLRDAYAETYPVRPLINHVDELRSALQSLADEVGIAAAHGVVLAINNGALIGAVELLAALHSSVVKEFTVGDGSDG